MEEKKTYQVGRGEKKISNWKREEDHISSKRENKITKKSHKHFLNAKSYLVTLM